MPLRVTPPNARSPSCRIRGTVRGIRVDQSARTPNRHAAEELAVKIEAELLERSIHGTPARASEPTFARAMNAYLDEAGRSEAVAYYLGPLVRHFGLRRLSEIDQAAVDAYITVRHPGAKPATVSRATIAPLTAVLRHAGVATRFRRPKIKNNKTRFLTRAEADRLIEKAAAHLRPLFIFLLNTGSRLSEALYLDWEQVDLVNRRVIFLDTKNGEARGCSLNTKAFEALANLPFTDRKKEKRIGPVFRTQTGYGYRVRTSGGGQIKTGWAYACKEAGIKNATPHTLRHTFASWLAMKGVPLRTLADLLGHKTLQMVMRYSHLAPEHLAAAVALLDEPIEPQASKPEENDDQFVGSPAWDSLNKREITQ